MVRFEKQEERHYSPREPRVQHSRGMGPVWGRRGAAGPDIAECQSAHLWALGSLIVTSLATPHHSPMRNFISETKKPRLGKVIYSKAASKLVTWRGGSWFKYVGT